MGYRKTAITIAAAFATLNGVAGAVVGFLLLVIGLLGPQAQNSYSLTPSLQPFFTYFGDVLNFPASQAVDVGLVAIGAGLLEIFAAILMLRRSRIAGMIAIATSILGGFLINSYLVILALAGVFAFTYTSRYPLSRSSSSYSDGSISTRDRPRTGTALIRRPEPGPDVKCANCGHEILDAEPRFCPRCGSEIAGQSPPPEPSREERLPASGPNQAPSPTNAGIRARDYLLVFLAFVGGVIGYRSTRKKNPRVASTILTIGLLITLVYIGAGYEVYSRVAGPPGVYGMTITQVTFPNSTTVAVTVLNQGKLEDGLESVAINNGTLWLVYGLLSPESQQASSEVQSGNLVFGLYGYILANQTAIPAGQQTSPNVGTEGFPPNHVDEITVPFRWTAGTTYAIAITTQSRNPYQVSATSPT